MCATFLRAIFFMLFGLCISGEYADASHKLIFKDDFTASTLNWSRNKLANNLLAGESALFVKAGTDSSAPYLSLTVLTPRESVVAWVSNRFNIGSMSYVSVTGKVGSDNVIEGQLSWHRASLTIQYFDINSAYIGKNDIIRFSGTHLPDTYNTLALVPNGAVSAQLVFGLVGCNGRATLHSVDVNQVDRDPASLAAFRSTLPGSSIATLSPANLSFKAIQIDNSPIAVAASVKVIPNPKNIFCTTEQIVGAGFTVNFSDKITDSAVKNNFREMISMIELSNIQPGLSDLLPIEIYLYRLPVGSETEIYGTSLTSIPMTVASEGYKIEVSKPGQPKKIKISALSDKGLFYGLQTLTQLVKPASIGNLSISYCQIRDWPNISVRGMGTGTGTSTYVKLLSKYKFNAIAISGGVGLWGDWDQPLTNTTITALQSLAVTSKKNYIEANVAIWPDSYGSIYTWTSNADQTTLLNQVRKYMSAGFSGLLIICASDYERVGRGNGIVSVVDIDLGLTVDEAHYNTVTNFYNALKYEFPNVNIQFFPFHYIVGREAGSAEEAYLKRLSQIPKDIPFMYSGRLEKKDLQWLTTTTGRKPIVRIPAPLGNTPVTTMPGETLSLLKYNFREVNPQNVWGIYLETPKDEVEMQQIAEFLWNF